MTDGSRILIIPRHHTIKQGTLKQILLSAGLTVEDFIRFCR